MKNEQSPKNEQHNLNFFGLENDHKYVKKNFQHSTTRMHFFMLLTPIGDQWALNKQ